MTMIMPAIGGFVEWWGLQESSGTRFGLINGNDLATIGAPSTRTGHVQAKAMDLSGNGQALYAADSTWNSFGDEDVTFCAWVYADNSSGDYLHPAPDWLYRWQGIMGKALEYDDKEYCLALKEDGAGVIEFGGNGSNSFNESPLNGGGSAAGSWWLTMGGFKTATAITFLKVYNTSGTLMIDASQAHSGHGGLANSGTSILFMIGALDGVGGTGDNSCYWDGAIEQAFIYNSIFSTEEEAWIVNGGAGRQYADLLLGSMPLMF